LSATPTGKRSELLCRADQARITEHHALAWRRKSVARVDICTVDGTATNYPSKIEMSLQEEKQMPVPKVKVVNAV
jgi:hypothetical protein